MTSNQLNYWRNQEIERSNKVNEAINQGKLSEEQRSNLVNEALQLAKNDLDFQRMIAQYGKAAWDQVPTEWQDQLVNKLGHGNFADAKGYDQSVWSELWYELSNKLPGFIKSVGSLF